MKSDRSQRLVQDRVNSSPPGNSLTAASKFNFSRPVSATADPLVQDTAPSNLPENTCNAAGNLNHLEMLSQYTRPGVAISVAQQEALYREYLQAQLQQSFSDQCVEQSQSPSGSGKLNPVNQVPVDKQNVALPPLQPPIQPPWLPTLWQQRTLFLYLKFQQTHRKISSWVQRAPVCLVNCICPSLMFHNNRIHLNVTFHAKHKSLLPIPCIMALHL